MKKIVRNLDFEAITDIVYIDNQSIVAIKWGSSAVSMVIQGKDGLFYGLSYNDFDSRDGWSRLSKKEYVESALNQEGTEAFEFNSYKELYEWLVIQ